VLRGLAGSSLHFSNASLYACWRPGMLDAVNGRQIAVFTGDGLLPAGARPTTNRFSLPGK